MLFSLRAAAAATLFLAAALDPSATRAQEAEPVSALRLNGFVTLGVTHAYVTQPWSFKRDGSQVPTDGGTRFDTDSRLGLQANYAVTPRLEAVAQLQLRRRAASSTAEENLEWGFVAWRPAADLTLRVGRTGPDVFLLSDSLSVGFSYPWVRPNVETYGGLPLFSIDGADIAQVWTVGDVRWRAKAWAGKGRSRVPAGEGAGGGDFTFKIRSMYGVALSREDAGLMLRATVVHGRGGLGALPGVGDLQGALAAAQSLPDPRVAAEARQLADGIDPPFAPYTYLALGAAYDRDRWLVSAELVRVISALSYTGSTAGYLSIGRRFDAVTFYGMVGAVRSTRGPVAEPQWEAALAPLVGAATAAQFQAIGSFAAGTSNHKVGERSGSLGLRWDMQPQLALKLQWDRILVRAGGSALWGRGGPQAASANVGSVALDFLF